MATSSGIGQGTAQTVAGYFDSETKAERAIDALEAAGFTSAQIGVAASGSSLPTSETGSSGAYGGSTTTGTHAHGQEGNFWGKVKDFFGAGDTAEAYSGEQTSGELGTREITSAGTGFGHDDLHGSLSNMSLSDEHARYFGGRLGSGGTGFLVTVTAGARTEEARSILESNGADIGSNPQSFAGTGTATAGTGQLSEQGAQNLQLYGEVLRVHKDRISRGEVRLRKEVHTETQTIEVPVTREELVIERVPVAGETAAVGATGEAFSEREIRIPLSEEHASVDKQAVLREEVRVGKRDVSEVERFNEQVRSEELKVEDGTTTGTTTGGTTTDRR